MRRPPLTLAPRTSGGAGRWPRLERVLIGVDFSTPSLAAARWVARHLVPGAEVVLAHVLPVPQVPEFLRGQMRPPDTFVRDVAAPMRGGLEGLATTLGAREVQIELKVGEPAEELAKLARTYDVGLVCVGRPRHEGDTVGLGRNTVDRLLRQLSVPLLQVSGEQDAPPTSLLAAVDGGPASAPALSFAWDLAARLEAQLTAIHVLANDVRAYVRAMEVAGGTAAQAGAAEEGLWKATAGWLGESLQTAGARAGRHQAMVGHGDPAREVLDAAGRIKADLLVVGRSGHDALASGAVGSTTRAVLRGAACPVLVVPDAIVQPGPPEDPQRRRARPADGALPSGATAA